MYSPVVLVSCFLSLVIRIIVFILIAVFRLNICPRLLASKGQLSVTSSLRSINHCQSPAAVDQYGCRHPPAGSPARFYHSRKFTLGCKITKTDPTNTELSQEPSGAATNRASVIGSYFEFRFLRGFYSKCFFCQIFPLICYRFL